MENQEYIQWRVEYAMKTIADWGNDDQILRNVLSQEIGLAIQYAAEQINTAELLPPICKCDSKNNKICLLHAGKA